MASIASTESRLFVALDVPEPETARQIVARIGHPRPAYKIGLELVMAGGLDLARQLKAEGHTIFLDMKYLDIPATVEKAVANAARLGVDYLTIHGTDTKTLDAAVKGRGTSGLKLLAVTVLTSLDQADLKEQGIGGLSPEALVLSRATRAKARGFDGVIASGLEAQAVRAAVGSDFLIVTPGIRPPGAAVGDQARVMSPREAINAGASHLVVGRPITAAADPAAAARAILADMG
ncbi:MAG: orotidine 5-phosphate decarboxylase [Pseudomonadota bacterium]|jgi:orotidine-5'-phosphate decarboxylase